MKKNVAVNVDSRKAAYRSVAHRNAVERRHRRNRAARKARRLNRR